MTMKNWYAQYRHKTIIGQLRGYTVVAEDDDTAGQVGFESLENDENNWNTDPRNWELLACSLIEVCPGCGGDRQAGAQPGHGAIR